MEEDEITGMEEEVLFIGDSDREVIPMVMDIDFIVVNDPRTNDQDDWCVLFTDGPYENFCVKFDNIGINGKTKDLVYQYEVLHTPEWEDQTRIEDIDMLHFNNTLTSALQEIIIHNHNKGANFYTDLETGKELKFE